MIGAPCTCRDHWYQTCRDHCSKPVSPYPARPSVRQTTVTIRYIRCDPVNLLWLPRPKIHPALINPECSPSRVFECQNMPFIMISGSLTSAPTTSSYSRVFCDQNCSTSSSKKALKQAKTSIFHVYFCRNRSTGYFRPCKSK